MKYEAAIKNDAKNTIMIKYPKLLYKNSNLLTAIKTRRYKSKDLKKVVEKKQEERNKSKIGVKIEG